MSCLRAPTFLGVHDVILGHDVILDEGALTLVVGAAHNEQGMHIALGTGTYLVG